jgi:GNAT superfamily N-acetyltransferase
MVEIRSIADGEGAAVAELWDEMCRTSRDGGPLTARGRRNIERMLDIAAWHRDELCLVALDAGRIVGFAHGRVSADCGMLPGLLGELETLYVTPGARGRGTSRALAQAAVRELRARGASVLHRLICIEDRAAQEFWSALGFERDMVCMSLYPEP